MKIEKGHGRLETRFYELFDITPLLKDDPDWHYIQEVIKVTRTRDKSKRISYYVSNTQLEIDQYDEIIRNHWSIEANNYIRDVSFLEDRTTKIKNPGVFARLLSTAKNILHYKKVKNVKLTLEKNAMNFDKMYKNLMNLE